MYCKLINITSPIVFKKYSNQYNVFRDLYEAFSFGMELTELSHYRADEIHQLLLKHGDISYLSQNGDTTNLFTIGSFSKLKEIAGMIRSKINEETGFSIDAALRNYEKYDAGSITIADTSYPLDRVYILGILNMTPDSFSDGGKYSDLESAAEQAVFLLDNGADIIDIGGESTRPGAPKVTPEEELERVIPVIGKIKSVRPDAVMSIDTTKAIVAEEALKNGVVLVNDISSMTFDPSMADIAAKYNAAVILMHIKGTPETMQLNPDYIDVVDEVYQFLYERIKFARKKNINSIIVDPGFGFGKNLNNNFELLNRMNEFKSLGCPILAGISRKSMLGNSLHLDIDNRDVATVISESIAVNNGARFIRTHNVENAEKLKQLYSFTNNPEILANV